MQNILVCFDGSKHALKALHIGCDLAEKYKAGLHVLEVLPLACGTDGSSPKADHLELARTKLVKRGIQNFKLEIDKGPPVPAILLAVKRHQIGTIIVGCRGKAGGEDGQLGSVSQALFQEAECTCIAVK